MLTIKAGLLGCRLTGIKGEMSVGVTIISDVARERKLWLELTACIDSKHKIGSLHYAGLAVDVVIREGNMLLSEVAAQLRGAIGDDFEVLVESTEHPHLHVEFQPKRAINA